MLEGWRGKGLKDYVCLDTRAQCPQIMSSLSIDAAAHSTQINPVSPPAYMRHFLHLRRLLLSCPSPAVSPALSEHPRKCVNTPPTHIPQNTHTHAHPRMHAHTSISPVLFHTCTSSLPLIPPSHSLPFCFFDLNISTRYTLSLPPDPFTPSSTLHPPLARHTHTHTQPLHSLHYLSRKLHFQHSQGPIMKRERHAVTFLKSH